MRTGTAPAATAAACRRRPGLPVLLVALGGLLALELALGGPPSSSDEEGEPMSESDVFTAPEALAGLPPLMMYSAVVCRATLVPSSVVVEPWTSKSGRR
jgi:hypothetical protein